MGVFIFIRRKWEEREISKVDMENNEAMVWSSALLSLFLSSNASAAD